MGEAVTEEKVVVVKEAKVAITKTLATLSAKLSVNNKFQRMYSLCGLCVCIYDIYFWICYALVSLSEAKKRERKQKEEKEEKRKSHTSIQTYKFHPCFFHDYSNYTQVPIIHTFSTSPDFIHSILSHPV